MTYRLCFFAISMMGSISQGLPSIWTGMMAFVFGVMSASIFAGSMVSDSSISARTGMAFIMAMVAMEAMKV